MHPYQNLDGAAKGWRRYKRTRRHCDEDVVSDFATASKSELVGVAAAAAVEL